MNKSITLSIPKELSGITLRQYQKYIKSVKYDTDKEPTKEEVDFANLKLLECFCDVTLKEAYQLPLAQFSEIINHLGSLFAEETPLERTIEMPTPKGEVVILYLEYLASYHFQTSCLQFVFLLLYLLRLNIIF